MPRTSRRKTSNSIDDEEALAPEVVECASTNPPVDPGSKKKNPRDAEEEDDEDDDFIVDDTDEYDEEDEDDEGMMGDSMDFENLLQNVFCAVAPDTEDQLLNLAEICQNIHTELHGIHKTFVKLAKHLTKT